MNQKGVFDTPIVEYSENTRNFIKELIRESRVNTFYQRKIEEALKENVPLKYTLRKSKRETGSSLCLSPSVQSSTSKFLKSKWVTKRSKDIIQRLMDEIKISYDFVPKLPKYDENSKRLCQDLMANEGLIVEIKKEDQKKELEETSEHEDSLSYESRRKQLLQEIEERLEWLSEMYQIGAGQEYEDLINSQIALRIRDIEFMDQKVLKISSNS